MIDKITVVLKDGTETSLVNWQKLYGLPVGSNKVGIHFSLDDNKLREDLKEYGALVVNEQLIRVLDAFRDKLGVPVNINSFNRSREKQVSLVKAGYRAAVFSPHEAKMAADVDTTSKEQTLQWVRILKEVSLEVGIKVRIGFMDYLNNGQSFIHIDVCPEYFAPGKPFNKKTHPSAWEQVITW